MISISVGKTFSLFNLALQSAIILSSDNDFGRISRLLRITNKLLFLLFLASFKALNTRFLNSLCFKINHIFSLVYKGKY